MDETRCYHLDTPFLSMDFDKIVNFRMFTCFLHLPVTCVNQGNFKGNRIFLNFDQCNAVAMAAIVMVTLRRASYHTYRFFFFFVYIPLDPSCVFIAG